MHCNAVPVLCLLYGQTACLHLLLQPPTLPGMGGGGRAKVGLSQGTGNSKLKSSCRVTTTTLVQVSLPGTHAAPARPGTLCVLQVWDAQGMWRHLARVAGRQDLQAQLEQLHAEYDIRYGMRVCVWGGRMGGSELSTWFVCQAKVVGRSSPQTAEPRPLGGPNVGLPWWCSGM